MTPNMLIRVHPPTTTTTNGASLAPKRKYVVTLNFHLLVLVGSPSKFTSVFKVKHKKKTRNKRFMASWHHGGTTISSMVVQRIIHENPEV